MLNHAEENKIFNLFKIFFCKIWLLLLAFLTLKKFTRAYLFQIALEIMWLPRLIMKVIKTIKETCAHCFDNSG